MITTARCKTVLALASLAPLLAACAQGGFDGSTKSYSMTARAGQRTYLGDYRTYDGHMPGCPTTSLPEVTILRSPAHGRVDLATALEIRAPASPVCRSVRRSAMAVFYTSERGFRGVDVLEYRVRFANGEVHAVRKFVAVR